jgi:predicted transcriptional regulator
MAESPLASARIPAEWMSQLDAIAAQTGKSRTDLVREAIAMYLGVVSPNEVHSDLKRLERRMEALEKKLKTWTHQAS